jgi:hypothetical protein
MNGSATSVATSTGLGLTLQFAVGVSVISGNQSSDSGNTTIYNNTPAVLSALIRM